MDQRYSTNVTRLNQPTSMMTDKYPIYGGETVDGNAAWDLFCAAADGHVPVIKSLLANDPRLVHAQFWYSIPLRFAVLDGHLEAAQLLMDAGSDPGMLEAHLFDWETFLEDSKSRGYDDVHQALLAEMEKRYGSEPYNDDFVALRDAIVDSQTEDVSSRLKESSELARISDVRGNTALHWAVWAGCAELVDRCCEAGGDPNAWNAAGETALQVDDVGQSRKHYRDSDPAIRRLIERGTECDFHTACYLGNSDLVRTSLANDPAIARRLNTAKVSPLTRAAAGGNVEIVAMLLDAGADPNMKERKYDRGGAVFTASCYGHIEVLKLLLERGADVNGPCESSGTAADHAANDEISQVLIENGSVGRWEEGSNDSNTLHDRVMEASQKQEDGSNDLLGRVIWSNDSELLALYLEKIGKEGLSKVSPGTGPGGWFIPKSGVPAEFLRQLISAGFPNDRPSWIGRTNLQFAASRNHCHNARLYLEHGADINFVSLETGTTPLGVASREGKEKMVNLLLESGADALQPAGRPQLQPRALARQRGHDNIVAILDAAK